MISGSLKLPGCSRLEKNHMFVLDFPDKLTCLDVTVDMNNDQLLCLLLKDHLLSVSELNFVTKTNCYHLKN